MDGPSINGSSSPSWGQPLHAGCGSALSGSQELVANRANTPAKSRKMRMFINR